MRSTISMCDEALPALSQTQSSHIPASDQKPSQLCVRLIISRYAKHKSLQPVSILSFSNNTIIVCTANINRSESINRIDEQRESGDAVFSDLRAVVRVPIGVRRRRHCDGERPHRRHAAARAAPRSRRMRRVPEDRTTAR